MSGDLKESIYSVHQAFREIAQHELSLAASLQNLAPSNTEPSASVLYLQENSLMLKALNERVKSLALIPSAADEK